MMTRKYASEFQKRHTHLIIGPWDHSCTPEVIDEYDFGPQADVDLRAMERSFLKNHLQGEAGEIDLPPVRIFVMGRNIWRDERSWPLERAIEIKFYLHSNSSPQHAGGPGTLSIKQPRKEKPGRFAYNPADPVPTIGGANSAPAHVLPMKRGPRDQRPVLDRDDVLLYLSGRLAKPVEVTGPIKLVLYASSSAPDTDFTGKLMDIGRDGNARILSDGIVRARYRKGVDRPERLVPGEPVKYEIDLWHTSNEFQPGHRIGLAVSSSNFPRFSRNLNTGGDNEKDADFKTADQTVYHSKEYPSHLILPILT